MEADLLTVPSSDLSLSIDDEQISKSDGLHVLTSGVMNTMENLDSGRPMNGITTFPPSELLASDMERDGEITLHSSLIPENAILMETPRGLMLTVPDGISYEDISPNDPGNRPMLSCVPVSFFKTCDVNEDGESNACDDVSVVHQTETIESHLSGKSSGIASISKNICEEDEDIQSQHQIQMASCIQAPAKIDNIEVVPVKRKGGWPKGRKRKNRPEVTAPRAPVTGYVLYAIDRRKEIKQLHPELSFSEITKVLGQEWSTMPSGQKDKFLGAAEKDKKRYREELIAFRSSETYRESKKILLQEDEMGSSNTNMGALVIDDEDNSTELHCKVCNVYFSSGHNKKEHMYGKTHLQNVTEAVDKEHKKQQQQQQREQQNLYNSFEGSSGDCLPAVDDSASWPNVAESNRSSSSMGTRQSGPVDIHHFMLEFIQKNYEREQEISSLRKHLNKSLQDNLIMCKNIQELQEYHCKLQEEVKALSSTTSSLIVQNDALKMVPTLFGIINL